MRYFIEFSYNGKVYCGWQSQPHMLSIQELLEKKMSLIHREPIALTGAGRTDSGVHARQMFAHFDTSTPLPINFVAKLNSFLPNDVVAKAIFEVSPLAHARFDAIERSYEYHIIFEKDPFESDFAYYLRFPLDIHTMNLACRELLLHTDFQCFSKVKTDVKTFNCKISYAHWEQEKNKAIFYISADRFLRNMVRAIVGTMILVGQGKLSLDDFKKIIQSKNRSKAGFSVPAHGLFLTKVEYPNGFF